MAQPKASVILLKDGGSNTGGMVGLALQRWTDAIRRQASEKYVS
jgi:hypothetical protein